jgi:sterol desaturase/sphingolipid hydroxylase (fatty acid hydroxylase superfamily)
MDLFDVSALRWAFTLGVIAVILGAESAVPFRRSSQSRLEHVSVNLIIYGGNSLVAQILAGWTLLVWSSYVTNAEWGLLYHLPLGPVFSVMASVIMLDLVAYGLHRLNHRVPLLWRFHRAHHSDLEMDATTSIRFHLGEVVLTTTMKALAVWAFGVPPAGFLISEILTLAAGLFSHANVRLPGGLEPRLRWAIVTPRMHWIHHSRRPAEHHTNLGAVFSGWDRLFGSYNMGAAQHEINFGLNEYPSPADVTFLRFYRIPFDKGCGAIDHGTAMNTSTTAPGQRQSFGVKT